MKVNKKGFTLAELLIVVAIVGILVAISVPIFTAQLEKSREAYDIATMRSAAAAAIDLYYAGVKDSDSAHDAGMSWEGGTNQNAYGAYDPKTSRFYPTRNDLPESSKTYGKGTKQNGGTTYKMGDRDVYAPGEDYTTAVVMVSIYPKSGTYPAHVDVYWKNNVSGNTKYVGGEAAKNLPQYSLRMNINE